MKFIVYIVFMIALFPFKSLAEENIRGIFFENKSPHMLGVRLINRNSRVEKHHIFDANSKEHVDTKINSFTLSAQLITSSFPISCCEWRQVQSGNTVTIEFSDTRNRCWCRIK